MQPSATARPFPSAAARLRRRGFVRQAQRACAGGQRGVTLIEILVAVVLLSIGLLGLAGLQLRGMQVNQGSMMRSQAAIMAEDLADRMRADFTAANPVNTTGSFYGAFTPLQAAAAAPAAMQDWLNGLAVLPGGVAAAANPVPCAGNVLPCVQVVALGTGTLPTPVQIDVWWNDTRASTGAVNNAANVLGTYRMVAELSNQY